MIPTTLQFIMLASTRDVCKVHNNVNGIVKRRQLEAPMQSKPDEVNRSSSLEDARNVDPSRYTCITTH